MTLQISQDTDITLNHKMRLPQKIVEGDESLLEKVFDNVLFFLGVGGQQKKIIKLADTFS